MIDQFTIDKILEAASIEDVVSDYVTLRRRGANLIGLCPFHNEKTPSFSVSPAKGICKCFSCGEGGNVVHFIMKHEQLSYYDALKFLAKKYNIEFQEKELTQEQKQAQDSRESMFIVNEFACQTFARNLFEPGEGAVVGLSYFRERGFRDDIIKKFQLGYAYEKKDAFSSLALKNGYKKPFLIATGLSLENETTHDLSDRFRGRVMFPVHSISGKIVAFGGRTLKKESNIAKYVNSPESEIYHKSNHLYGLFLAKQGIVKRNHCILVEGYTDVISMFQSGIENVVASSGTALTAGQIRLIHRFTENITVIYDGDAAGIKASLRGIDLLLEEGLKVKVVLLPDGEDPDSFARKHSAVELNDYIESHQTDFIRFKIGLLMEEGKGDPLQKANLVTETVRTISLIPDQITRTVYIKECSSLLDVNEKVLYSEINKIGYSKLEKEIEKNLSRKNTPTVLLEKDPFAEVEKEMIRVIVKYGTSLIEEEGGHSVISFIKEELEHDELTLHDPLYQEILQEASSMIDRPGFVCPNYFLSHPKAQVSRLAVDLISERYLLSKMYEKSVRLRQEAERLPEVVSRLLMEFRDAVVTEQIKEIQTQIKQLSSSQDQKIVELLTRMQELTRLKQALSKELGERILN